MRRTLLSMAVFLMLLICSNAQERPARRPGRVIPEGVRAVRDVEYVSGGGRSQSLDLYLPEKSGQKMPLIIWIHGGAWKAGDKANCQALPLVEKGYAVASLNYRLSQQAIFPAQIEDCKAAIRWLRAHAEDYNLDAGRFGVWGSSAGGHLVALLGTSGDVKELEGKLGNAEMSSKVQAVCDWFGPTDLTQMEAHALTPGKPFNHDSPDSPESKLIGGAVQENRDKALAASPLTYVTPDDPPFLIMHGDKDPLVPYHQSEIFETALKKAGVEAVLHTIEGAGHGFGGPEIMMMVQKFFDRHLKCLDSK